MAINSLLKVSINNSNQWILVRGKNANAPLILQVQAGPGLPMICEANMLQKKLALENEYLVAYWDQRACGKSFDRNADPNTINLSQSADDIIACTKYLLRTYQKEKLILIGYSFGATTALMAASKDSSLFSSLFLVGMDIDLAKANSFAFEFAKEQARKNSKNRLLKEIEQLSLSPVTTASVFQKRAKIISDFGGIISNKNYRQIFMETLKNMLISKEYSLKDILKTINGMNFCQNALLPKVDNFNLFYIPIKTSVPLHFIQGDKDALAPVALAKQYFDYISSTNKTFAVFEHSAHMPHLEEPQRFHELIKSFTK